MPRTAVLIPCYNEEKTIRDVIVDFQTVMPHAVIYVYDNNSTDDTAKIASECGAIVRHEYRQGKGNVVRTMFKEIEADCYIMVDGDNTYPASDAPKLEQLVLEGKADMAVGDRLSSTYFTENKRHFHNSGNRMVRWLVNHLFKAKLHDIMTGMRAFSREFVKTFPVLSKGFEIETEMTVFALDGNFRIVEVPIDYRDRPPGSESKLSTYLDGWRVLTTIGSLFRDTRPLAFFNTITLILLIIAACFFFPVLADFHETGLVAKVPTLIVVSAVGVCAMLAFFSGVILSALRKQHRQDFEHKLMELHYLYGTRPFKEEGERLGKGSLPENTGDGPSS